MTEEKWQAAPPAEGNQTPASPASEQTAQTEQTEQTAPEKSKKTEKPRVGDLCAVMTEYDGSGTLAARLVCHTGNDRRRAAKHIGA